MRETINPEDETMSTHNHNAIPDALRAFSEAALALAEALEGADPVDVTPAEPTVLKLAEPAEEVPRSYSTGRGRDKRARAIQRARSAGYDFEHWCLTVKSLRVAVLRVRGQEMADIMGISKSAINSWETGLAFANLPQRARLEQLGNSMAGWERSDWKGERMHAEAL